MSAVCEAARVHTVFERVGNLLADDHAAKRYVSGVDAFCEADQVGGYVPLVDGKPLAATAEAGHHFVAHHDDAVAIANFANALEVAVWWNQNTVCADNRFEADHGNSVWAFNHQYVFEMLQCTLALFLCVGGMECRTVGVWSPKLHCAGSAGFVWPTTWVASKCNRACGRTVVRAVHRQDFVSAGVKLAHAHGIFCCFSTAVGEEHHVQVAWG